MIPSQEEHNPKDPRQHFVWALRNMPLAAGVGAVTHPKVLETWSEHLWKTGAVHVDYLRSLADEDGNIHVSKLPRQQIKFQAAFRGQRHDLNHAARWVSVSEPDDPTPVVIPDIRKMTQQENEYMLRQYQAAGMIPASPVGPVLAEVEDV